MGKEIPGFEWWNMNTEEGRSGLIAGGLSEPVLLHCSRCLSTCAVCGWVVCRVMCGCKGAVLDFNGVRVSGACAVSVTDDGGCVHQHACRFVLLVSG